MKRRIPIYAAVLIALAVAVITFQITYLSVKVRGSHAQKLADAERSECVGAKLSVLDETFRRYYIGTPDEDAITDAVLRAYLRASGDAYAQYLSPEELRALIADSAGESEGIGALVTFDPDTCSILILSVTSGGPAEAAGVRPGDRIVSVDHKAVSEIGYHEASEMLRGKAGTAVTFTLADEGDGQRTVTLIRAAVDEITVTGRTVTAGGICYGLISISSFDGKTPAQFAEAVDTVRSAGAEMLIFDVRNNPGGTLDSIVTILDTLLPEGVIVRIEDAEGKETVYSSDAEELCMPMAVLVNGDTASAAELFAAALHDYEKAVLVGTKTYGKGSVQTIVKLADGSAFRVTYRIYKPPKSDGYNGIGLIPDIPVEPGEELNRFGIYRVAEADDNQLQTAIAVLSAYGNFDQ